MRLSHQLAAISLSAALLPGTPALAQTRFCLGGDLGQLTAAQRSACNATLQKVRDIAAALHAPADWHFVVVCGEEGWKQYTAFEGEGARSLENASANTDLFGHETFFRERDLEVSKPLAPTRLVAHEVATIQLQTIKEASVQPR